MQKLLNKRNQSPWHELSEILNLINEEVPCDNHVKKCRRHAGFKKKTPIDELYLQLEKCRLDRRASNLFWNFQNDSKTKLCHINLRMNHPVPARKKLLFNGKKKKNYPNSTVTCGAVNDVKKITIQIRHHALDAFGRCLDVASRGKKWLMFE